MSTKLRPRLVGLIKGGVDAYVVVSHISTDPMFPSMRETAPLETQGDEIVLGDGLYDLDADSPGASEKLMAQINQGRCSGSDPDAQIRWAMLLRGKSELEASGSEVMLTHFLLTMMTDDGQVVVSNLPADERFVRILRTLEDNNVAVIEPLKNCEDTHIVAKLKKG
jgi:hypothetical protein